MFITAYHSVETKGSEMFALVYLLAFFLHLYSITTHLNMNRTAWARTRIAGMAAAVFLLCLGMVIPKDHFRHTIAIPAIIIFTVLLEACVLIHKQIKEEGGNQNFLRDLQIAVAEILIAIYQFVDCVVNAHSPWIAEKILHLVGSGLPVLIGACHVGWIAYKGRVISKVVEWLRKIPVVLAGKEEQVPEGAAAVSDGDGDVEEQVVLAGEEEQVAGEAAAVSDGDSDVEEQVGEEGLELVVAVVA